MKNKITKLKRVAVGLCIVLGFANASAQSPITYQWVQGIGGKGSDQASSVATDADGNVFTVGTFTDTVKFSGSIPPLQGHGPSNNDIFVTKTDPAGNIIWAHEMGGLGRVSSNQVQGNDFGKACAVDKSGNVYIGGSFQGQPDFDPGPNTFNLSCNTAVLGATDAYVVKLDKNGNFLWAKRFGGDYGESVQALATDSRNNVIICGLFQTTVDFDPGPGVYNMSDVGNQDAFFVSLDSNGNFRWAHQVGGDDGGDNNYGWGVTVDENDNVYGTGQFIGIMKLGPKKADTVTAVGIYNDDIFVTKYDSAGHYQWVKPFGGTGSDYANAIYADKIGSIYVTGVNQSANCNFNPDKTGTPITVATLGGNDIFVLKLDTGGAYKWVKGYGSTHDDVPFAITTDKAGNVYTTGSYSDSIAFNPATGASKVVNKTFTAALPLHPSTFLSKMDSTGKYVYAYGFNGIAYSFGHGISLSPDGSLYVTGTMGQAYIGAGPTGGSVDYNVDKPFNPGISDTLMSKGAGDGFLVRFACQGSDSTITVASCSGTYTFNNQTYTQSGTYVQHFARLTGCDSIFHINLTVNNIIPVTITVNHDTLGTATAYVHYQWFVDGNLIPTGTNSTLVVKQNGVYKVAVINATGCTDTVEYTVTNYVGINNVNSAIADIKVYPNPASDMVHVSASQAVTVMLTSMEGKIVNQVANVTNANISVKNLATGIYLVRITNADGTLLKVEKLVKDK